MKTSRTKLPRLFRRHMPAVHLIFAPAILTVLCAGTASARAEIPEPPTLFYGQIINRTSGQLYMVTNGTLVWKILPLAGGEPVVLTATVGSFGGFGVRAGLATEPDGPTALPLSYRLKVPHHALSPGALVPAATIPLTQDGLDFQHSEISVDGFPATIRGEGGGTFRLAQNNRATAFRLDLELVNPLADSDGDGLPDWWEDRFGLDRYFAGDAALDGDGDGASNHKEFLAGSDPNAANTSPKLATSHIPSTEGGTVGLRLRVLDSDSQPADLRYTLLSPPAGGGLYLRNGSAGAPGEPGSDRRVLANDHFTQADVEAGRLVFRHEDRSVTSSSLELAIADEDPGHAAWTGSVAIVFAPAAKSLDNPEAPSAPEEGACPAVWLDASTLTSGATWPDRSGHHFDASPLNTTPFLLEMDAPGARQSLLMGGTCWTLAVPDEQASFSAAERTVFAVFKAEGAGQVFGGTRFELGVTGTDNPMHPGQLRYGTESAALYSVREIQGRWVVASAWQQGSQSHLEVNGLWCAGPNARAESSTMGNKSAVGGKAVGHFNAVTQSWEYEPAELLNGKVGEILVFNRALNSAERQRVNYHLLSKWFGYVMWDASEEAAPVRLTVPSAGLDAASYANYVAANGPDRPNILVGGAGADELCGGMEQDVLVGGPGRDRLAGGGHGDVFAFRAGDGNDTVVDFRPNEGDVLDLSDLLAGSSRNLADYVQLSTAGTNSWLRVNTAGTGTTFTNVEITLLNTVLRPSDLDYLWANGNLVGRGIGINGPPWVNVVANRPAAGEEGPTPGEFTLSRSGSAETALSVTLSIGGSAVNGVDYALLGTTATFAPGQSSLKISVQPYVDSLVEVPEVVEVMIMAGTGYNVGDGSRAQVTIADLPERISIEVVEPFASRANGLPGYILVNRSGLLSRNTVVRLGVGGTALNGVDYQYVSGFVLLSPSQSSALIPITPIAAAGPVNGAKSVEIRILPDPNSVYLPGTLTTGRVWLVEETLNLGLWRARSLPGSTTDLVLLAGQDPDHDGLVNLVEYSLGSDPSLTDAAAARALLPRATIRDGHLVVEFWKRIGATDLAYVVEVSGDLVTWQAGSPYVEEITLPEFAARPEMVCFRDRTPCTGASQRYIRVRVRFQP